MSSIRLVSVSVSLLALFVGGGCDAEVSFSDAIDTTIDFRAAPDRERTLHAPYVVGASFEMRAHGADRGETLVSSDPDVLAIEGDGAIVRATAVAPGMATLMLVDADDDVVAAVDVEVAMPTRAVLHAAAPVFLDRADVPSDVTAPRIIEGGEASFVVHYFDGATRLAGSGGLEVAGSGGVAVHVKDSLLGEQRDWLHVATGAPGIEQLTLAVGGEAFAQIDVEVVGADAVADLDVFASESAEDGDAAGVVIATAYDLDGEPVYGVPFAWRAGAGTEAALGDVVRVAPGTKPMVLGASFHAVEGEVGVHGGDAEVHGAGCAVAGAVDASWYALLIVVAIATRRR